MLARVFASETRLCRVALQVALLGFLVYMM